jgi:glycosyltransferase involved in cell wall biosynthesis
MKIAMIGQKGIPARGGGIEQHVDILSQLLVERGHEVIVYCRRSYCGDENRCRNTGPGSDVHRGQAVEAEWGSALHRIFRPSIATKHLDAITHAISSTWDVLFRDVDVVHYHAIGPAALAPVARWYGLPTVVTCHGLDWQRAKWGAIARRCLRFGEWLAARFAAKLVVVSEPLRTHFAHTHGVESTFIPNAVAPMARSEPRRIRQWGLRRGEYLLAASRLVPEKGLHYLISAFRAIETDVKLVIAGGGGIDRAYERELRRSAGPRVIFTGNADRELLSELYCNALLFVLPSEVEGMSIALLEAMSCGLPVLVSDIPENTCVVGADGFTFRSRDALHLRAALDSLLDSRGLLFEFGERCRARAEQYQWPHVVTQLEQVYHAALGVRRKPVAGDEGVAPQPGAQPDEIRGLEEVATN